MSPALIRAAELMAAQRYQESGAAYEAIVATEPQHAAMAASQVGVAHFFLGNYALAIQWYEHAGQLGCDAQMIRENIEEATAMLASGPGPGPGEREYAITEDNHAWTRVGAGEWTRYDRPWVGDVVLRANGGMWAMGSTGWAPHTADSAGQPPPAAGESLLHITTGRFFTLAGDGSWTVRPDPITSH